MVAPVPPSDASPRVPANAPGAAASAGAASERAAGPLCTAERAAAASETDEPSSVALRLDASKVRSRADAPPTRRVECMNVGLVPWDTGGLGARRWLLARGEPSWGRTAPRPCTLGVRLGGRSAISALRGSPNGRGARSDSASATASAPLGQGGGAAMTSVRCGSSLTAISSSPDGLFVAVGGRDGAHVPAQPPQRHRRRCRDPATQRCAVCSRLPT